MRAVIIVIALAALVRAEAAPAPAPYAAPARVAYLERSLAAARTLGATGRGALEQALYTGGRASCRAALAPPTIACMIDLAQATCGARADRDACQRVADVILTNQRAETELVDQAARMRLVASGTDYHTALLAEVARHHAVLAADLLLAEPEPLGPTNLAARIDRFCADRGAGLDYQRCAAALVWYITTQEAR